MLAWEGEASAAGLPEARTAVPAQVQQLQLTECSRPCWADVPAQCTAHTAHKWLTAVQGGIDGGRGGHAGTCQRG